MKIIFLFLLLIPIFGIAQTERVRLNSFRKGYFDFNQGVAQQIDYYKSSISAPIKPLVSNYLNATDEYKMLLDSFYEVDFNPTSNTSMLIREYYQYDDKGNVILLTNYTPCEGCAVSTYKIESEFDDDSKITMDSYYFWDFTAKQWVRARKNIYTYNTNGFLITFMENMWYNGAKLNPSKTEFSNDDHGNVLSKIRSRYDSITGE